MKIGIDIGGSHIGIGLVDEFGKLLTKKEKELTKEEKQNIENKIAEILINLINEILIENNIEIKQIQRIGVAIPGRVDNNGIINTRNLNFHDYNLKQIIQKKFDTEIIIRNDAKAAALCEKKYGVLKDYSEAIFLGLGTGIGGAVFLDNKLQTCKNTQGFEIGHIILVKDGLECNCGKRGCFEQYASMKVFKNKIKEKLKLDEKTTGKEIVKILENDNKICKDIIKEYVSNLEAGIASLVEIFEPEIIALGGSFSYYEDILLEPLKQELDKSKSRVLKRVKPKIVIAKYKNDAGIIGVTI